MGLISGKSIDAMTDGQKDEFFSNRANNPFATREDYNIAQKAVEATIGKLTSAQLQIFDQIRVESQFKSDLKNLQPGKVKTAKDYAKEYEGKKIVFDGLSTGLPTLDQNFLLGIKPGDVITIGGQTGVGKSPFAVNLCLQMNAQGRNCLLLGLEDSPYEVGTRIAFVTKGLTRRKNKISLEGGGETYVFTDQDVNILYQKKFALMPLLKAYAKIVGVHVVVLDMLNDIIDPLGDKDADAFMVQLKNVVDELGITLIMIARLREAKEQAESVLPSEDSIYGKGMIKYLSTKIITISIDPINPFSPRSGMSSANVQPLWFHVVKNRQGYKTSKQRVAVSVNFVTADDYMYFEERGDNPLVSVVEALKK